MTDAEAELDEIARRADAATPGPWDALDSDHERWHFTAPNGDCPEPGCLEWQVLGGQAPGLSTDWGWSVLHGEADRHAIHPRREDLEFVAAARVDVPALVKEVRRLRAALTAVVEGATAGHLATAAAIARAALEGRTP